MKDIEGIEFNPKDVGIISIPKSLCYMYFNNDEHFQIRLSKPCPNWWRRFWYWLLLDIRWEKLGENDGT